MYRRYALNFNIDWDKLKLFYVVARAQSITLAAQQLNISQSALSRSVSGLEDRMKTKLLHRHSKGVALTEKGAILLKGAEEMIKSIETAKTSLSEMEASPYGILKIQASPGAISRLFLTSNAKPFLKTYPNLRLKIIMGKDSPSFTLGGIEAALYPYIEDEDDLIQEYLFSAHQKLYASPEYLKEFGTPQSVEDLDHHQLLAYGEYPYPSANVNWHLSVGCPEGKVREPYMQVNLSHSLVALAAQGIGIVTLAEESTSLNRSDNTLVSVLPHVEGPTLKFYYIYPAHLKNSRRVQALGTYLHEAAEREGLK